MNPVIPQIHILSKFHAAPWGGGNQFLKALRKESQKGGFYAEHPQAAQIIIFNSYPFGAEGLFGQIFALKKRDPAKIVILRLDGPFALVRGRDNEIDQILALFAHIFVDGIIFQSQWSRAKNKKYFQIDAPFETVINNAPNSQIFNRPNKKFPHRRLKIITTVWSPNPRKGFPVYQYLDAHLDFTKYAMTLVGNAPISFKNIKHLPPVPSTKIAALLKSHDVFLTASQNDPCSNALIEALACGLPAIALDDGGHPELVQKGGILFKNRTEIIPALRKIRENYLLYQQRLPKFSMRQTAQAYYDFGHQIWEASLQKEYQPKQITLSQYLGYSLLRSKSLLWQAQNRLRLNKR